MEVTGGIRVPTWESWRYKSAHMGGSGGIRVPTWESWRYKRPTWESWRYKRAHMGVRSTAHIVPTA